MPISSGSSPHHASGERSAQAPQSRPEAPSSTTAEPIPTAGIKPVRPPDNNFGSDIKLKTRPAEVSGGPSVAPPPGPNQTKFGNLTQRDIAAGLNTHAAILRRAAVMPPSAVVSAVESVYKNMVNTGTYSRAMTIPPTVYVLNGSTINAFATFGGKLYVYRGLVEAVQGNQGVLAFVIGHEMIHNLMQHGIKRHLRAVEANYDIRLAYRKNTWAGIAAEAAHKIIEAKLQREEEHQADKLGLLMAAEAGYHPDFAILASRILKMETGESSKLTAFFEGHPRWTTREQRAEGIRQNALQMFDSRWPNASESPGGAPPTMVAVDEIKVTKQPRGQHTLTFHTDVRHVHDGPVEVAATIIRDRATVPTQITHQRFVVSEEKNWTVDLGQHPKDEFGKRFVKITATMDGKILYESDTVKVD